MKARVALLMAVAVAGAAHAAGKDVPPPMILDSGPVRVEKTISGYTAYMPDGKEVRWHQGPLGSWSDGRNVYSENRFGTWFRPVGGVTWHKTGKGWETTSGRKIENISGNRWKAGTNTYERQGATFIKLPRR